MRGEWRTRRHAGLFAFFGGRDLATRAVSSEKCSALSCWSKLEDQELLKLFLNVSCKSANSHPRTKPGASA